jgi:DNA-binding beta-propeller fold protein YncE
MLAFLAPTSSSEVKSSFLKVVSDVPLPGPAVRFDYQSLDPTHDRLYISHMNADQLVVFDVAKFAVVGNLDGFKRVHGVWAVPELGRVYASATGDHELAVVDMLTLKIIARAGHIAYPDGIAYAPNAKRVFVSDERGNADAVLDVQTNTIIKNIPLPGGAGNTVFDPVTGHILVGVHDANELVVIDPARGEIIGSYPTTGAEDPHGIALDLANRLAFVAGSGNDTLALMDLNTMRVTATYPVGDDPDVLAFDPGLKLLYLSAESGHVTIFQESAGKLTPKDSFFMPHAHTVCVDPKTHLVYFPLENVNGHPVLRIMEPKEK